MFNDGQTNVHDKKCSSRDGLMEQGNVKILENWWTTVLELSFHISNLLWSVIHNIVTENFRYKYVHDKEHSGRLTVIIDGLVKQAFVKLFDNLRFKISELFFFSLLTFYLQ